MKQVIRLTESDLHKLIKESVKKILNERTRGELGMTDDEVISSRNNNGGYEGHTEKIKEPDLTYDKFITPHQERLRVHSKSRGLKKPLAKTNGNGDYNDYVKNFLKEKYNAYDIYIYGGGEDGSSYDNYLVVPVEDRWGEEAYQIEMDFKKYGYGLNEALPEDVIEFELEDEGVEIDPEMTYLPFKKGESLTNLEIDDPGLSPTYFQTRKDKLQTPKIGTTDFMKQK